MAYQKGDAWHCQFLYHGRRHTFSLGKVSRDEAVTKANQIDYFLVRLRQNLLQLPLGMDIVTFVQFDGNPPQDPADGEILTLGALRDEYLHTRENGSLEPSTVEGIRLHFKHLIGTLGERFPGQASGRCVSLCSVGHCGPQQDQPVSSGSRHARRGPRPFQADASRHQMEGNSGIPYLPALVHLPLCQ
jgi:hypothetical protein